MQSHVAAALLAECSTLNIDKVSRLGFCRNQGSRVRTDRSTRCRRGVKFELETPTAFASSCQHAAAAIRLRHPHTSTKDVLRYAQRAAQQ